MRACSQLAPLLALGFLALACERPAEQRLGAAIERAKLAGELTVTPSQIELVQQVGGGLDVAESLASDTVLAAEARSRWPELAETITRASLARRLIEKLREETLRQQPATPEEVAAVVREHWVRLDRPRAVRSAVVRIPVPEMSDDAPYRQLADELRSKAEGAFNLASLVERLDQVETSYEVQRMRMPPIAADGRVVPIFAQDHAMQQTDPYFAQAVTALSEAGELSPVFATKEAFQFLFCVEVLREQRTPTPEQDAEVLGRVAARRLKEELARLQSKERQPLVYSKKDLGALLKLAWRGPRG